MSEWKEYKLEDVCSISSSKRIFAKEYQENGIPFYRGKEIIEKQKGIKISQPLYISETKYSDINQKFGVPEKGDMLLTSVGTLGVPYIVCDEKFYFKDGNITWFSDFNGINNQYLYYWFFSPIAKNQITTKAIGSTQKALTIDTLKKFEISLPTINIQNRIVSILKSLDDKIELNRRINENLEQQAQALFKHWFVDFEFPNAEGKPYKSAGGKLVDSELGAIPEGWKVLPIEHLAEKIASGGTPQSLNQSYYEGNIKWFTTKELKDCFLFDSEKHISDAAVVNSSAKLFPAYSVLMALYGVTATKLGILQNSATFNQAAVGIIPKKDIGYAFIYLTLLSERSNLNNLASGAAQQNLNVRIVKSYKVVIPPLSLLNSFNLIANSYFEQIKNNTIVNVNTAQLRDILLPKLMNGELNIEEYA